MTTVEKIDRISNLHLVTDMIDEYIKEKSAAIMSSRIGGWDINPVEEYKLRWVLELLQLLVDRQKNTWQQSK